MFNLIGVMYLFIKLNIFPTITISSFLQPLQIFLLIHSLTPSPLGFCFCFDSSSMHTLPHCVALLRLWIFAKTTSFHGSLCGCGGVSGGSPGSCGRRRRHHVEDYRANVHSLPLPRLVTFFSNSYTKVTLRK